MLNKGGALLYSLALICPRCRRGHMFTSLFTMRRQCAVCGLVFERDPGEVSGGMAINMVLTSVLGVVAVIYGTLFTSFPPLPMILVLCAAMVVFGLLFYRHARGVWVGFLYITGAISENVPQHRPLQRS